MHPVLTPPRWAAWLLRRLHPAETLEEVQGDLEELYAGWLERHGRRRAAVRYGLAVLSVLPPLVRRRRSNKNSYPQPSYFQTHMLRNYFIVAWRNLVRYKGYSAINVGGLAVGMAVAMLNGLWIWDELSFNQYHQHYERIVKVMEGGIRHEGDRYANTSVPYPLATELKTSYGRHFTHLLIAREAEEFILAAGPTKLTRKGQFIEPGAPEMLTLKMLRGTRAGLQDPHSILLSASAARALFGDADPLDRPVRINTQMDAKVTGVYEDLPHNTEFHDVKFLAPFDLWVSVNPWAREQQWNNWFLLIYAQMAPGADPKAVSALIKDIELNKLRAIPGREELVARQPQIYLLPMPRWHLYGRYEAGDRGPARLVRLVGLIGAFVLLLACINFMNLSTARSEKRAREVGIRKAVGSRRGQLVGQFFSESLLVAVLAFGLALLLTGLALPWFNQLAAKQITLPLGNPWLWLPAIPFVLLTGLVAGSYPALYLSSFQPVKVLKGTFRVGNRAATPRKVLVVVQFTVSITLTISSLIVYRQIGHAKNRPVGYSQEGLVLVEKKTDDFKGKYEALRGELLRTGVVSEVAESRSSVTGLRGYNGGFSWKGKELVLPQNPATQAVTPAYGRTIGWQFVAGRDFTPGRTVDSAGLVVNESFARGIGTPNPVGETIAWKPGSRAAKYFTVLGVVKDMVVHSPYEPTLPVVYYLADEYGWINIRLNPAVSAAEALPRIEAVFKKLIPSAPFDYQFADQEYALKFAAEERIGKLAAFFASLAIFISCLGLFGLAAFTAEQRTKEIGIRKVLGASVGHLWGLLSKDFLYLVSIAFAIAALAAYYFLSGWLQHYAYRTTLPWWIFAGAGGAALLITLVTVSFQAVKAAVRNPVKSLRTE